MLKKKEKKDPYTDCTLNYSGSAEGDSPEQELLLEEIN